jgi:hypothetical protein
LNTEIEGFLLRTALWTNQWFNKPKFHIFIHLTCHIRRFGPAILFATEAFESFNAIIRAKSIHSNRQAPSSDIALAFAQANQIRHLMSGGMFVSNNTFQSSGELIGYNTGAGKTAVILMRVTRLQVRCLFLAPVATPYPYSRCYGFLQVFHTNYYFYFTIIFLSLFTFTVQVISFSFYYYYVSHLSHAHILTSHCRQPSTFINHQPQQPQQPQLQQPQQQQR